MSYDSNSQVTELVPGNSVDDASPAVDGAAAAAAAASSGLFGPQLRVILGYVAGVYASNDVIFAGSSSGDSASRENPGKRSEGDLLHHRVARQLLDGFRPSVDGLLSVSRSSPPAIHTVLPTTNTNSLMNEPWK